MDTKEKEWQSTINRFIKIYPDPAGFIFRRFVESCCLWIASGICLASNGVREAKMIRQNVFVSLIISFLASFFFLVNTTRVCRENSNSRVVAENAMWIRKDEGKSAIGRKVQIEVTFELITFNHDLPSYLKLCTTS